METKKVTL